MPYEPSGAVPTSTVTSVTNWAPVCTVPGQPSVACAAWLRAGMNAVATLASAMLAQGSERGGLLWPPFTFGIFPRAAGIVPGASRESRAPGVVFAARSARDRMTMDQPRLGRHRDDENPSRRRAEAPDGGGWRMARPGAHGQEKAFSPSSRRKWPTAGRRDRTKIRSRLLLNQVPTLLGVALWDTPARVG